MNEDKFSKMEMEVTPFDYNDRDPFIACVGINGGTTDTDILLGFSQSIDLMYQSLKGHSYEEDSLVYPMAFAARHCVELGLKITIRDMMHLLDFPKVARKIAFDKEKAQKALLSHNVENLTETWKNLLKIDKRLGKFEDEIIDWCKEYFFDPDETMFRYEKSKDGSSNLEGNVSQVSLSVLYGRHKEFMQRILNLIDCCIALYSEYHTGSYTKTLSRHDIEEIADFLPPKTKWIEAGFEDSKKRIMKHYSIGGRELSDAINIIKTVPYFSCKIGLEQQIHDIHSDELEAYARTIQIDKDTHKVSVIKIGGVSINTLEEISDGYKPKRVIADQISADAFCCLFAFYYISIEDGYCEQFDEYYKYVKDSKFHRDDFVRKLCRVDSYRRVKAGMDVCGQESYIKTMENILKSNESNK